MKSKLRQRDTEERGVRKKTTNKKEWRNTGLLREKIDDIYDKRHIFSDMYFIFFLLVINDFSANKLHNNKLYYIKNIPVGCLCRGSCIAQS